MFEEDEVCAIALESRGSTFEQMAGRSQTERRVALLESVKAGSEIIAAGKNLDKMLSPSIGLLTEARRLFDSGLPLPAISSLSERNFSQPADVHQPPAL